MLPDILLALIAVLPLMLLLVLRSNAAIVFLAACSGVLLQQQFGPDAHMILDALLPRSSSVYKQALDIGLVALVPLVAMIMLRKKAKGFKYLLGVIPGICTGLLMVLALVPFVSSITQDNMRATEFWRNLYEFRGAVVLLGVASSLLILKPSKKHEDAHKKHHK
ncbi:MAG: hypothetical protein KIH63_005745 [Candidatus Saccharibacteria bacterium]|nr:hypothetical protein [Candidatus Saccharibacteria bacterium]